ncbi:MAG: tetratricopeptide repeat protein, partial [Thermoguttaceae bacterium]
MSTASREERIVSYNSARDRIEELIHIGHDREALEVVEKFSTEANNSGDEDFRSYFESQKIRITAPDPAQQFELLDSGIQWAYKQNHSADKCFYLEIGRLYLDNGDTNSASAWFNESLKLNQSDGDTLRMMGCAIMKNGDSETAIKWFEAALEATNNGDSASWVE